MTLAWHLAPAASRSAPGWTERHACQDPNDETKVSSSSMSNKALRDLQTRFNEAAGSMTMPHEDYTSSGGPGAPGLWLAYSNPGDDHGLPKGTYVAT